MHPLTVKQIREIDRQSIEQFAVPGIVLMENAGRSAAELLLDLGCRGQVLILCGKGNNAGDGLVIARHLDLAKVQVQILTSDVPQRWQGDTAINWQIVRASQLDVSVFDPSQASSMFASADWILDALLGTGATGPPRAPMDQMIRLANQASACRFAVDIPSGLDADTGLVEDPCFRADHTCTFVAPKIGFSLPSAMAALGTVHVVGIGAPRQALLAVGGRLPSRDR